MEIFSIISIYLLGSIITYFLFRLVAYQDGIDWTIEDRITGFKVAVGSWISVLIIIAFYINHIIQEWVEENKDRKVKW